MDNYVIGLKEEDFALDGIGDDWFALDEFDKDDVDVGVDVITPEASPSHRTETVMESNNLKSKHTKGANSRKRSRVDSMEADMGGKCGSVPSNASIPLSNKVAALNPSAAIASAESMKQAIEEEIETLKIDPNSTEGKMKKKQIRNRLSAQLHRDNKKQYITDLEHEVAQYKEQAESLKALLMLHVRENEMLRSQILNQNHGFVMPEALVCPDGTFENSIVAAVPPSKINFDALDAAETSSVSSNCSGSVKAAAAPKATKGTKTSKTAVSAPVASAPVAIMPAPISTPMEVSPTPVAATQILPHVIPSLQEYYSSLYKKSPMVTGSVLSDASTAVPAAPTHAAARGQATAPVSVSSMGWNQLDAHNTNSDCNSGSDSDHCTSGRTSPRLTHRIATVSNYSASDRGSSSGHSSDEYESSDEFSFNGAATTAGRSTTPTPPPQGPSDGIYLSNLFLQAHENQIQNQSYNAAMGHRFPAYGTGTAAGGGKQKKASMVMYSIMFLFGFSFLVGSPVSSLSTLFEGVNGSGDVPMESHWRNFINMFSSRVVSDMKDLGLKSDLEVDFNQDVIDILMEAGENVENADVQVKTEPGTGGNDARVSVPSTSSADGQSRVLLSTNNMPGLYDGGSGGNIHSHMSPHSHVDTKSNQSNWWTADSEVSKENYQDRWAKYASQLISTASGNDNKDNTQSKSSNAVAIHHSSRFNDMLAKLELSAPHSNEELYQTYIEMLSLLSRYEGFKGYAATTAGQQKQQKRQKLQHQQSAFVEDVDATADLLAKQLWIYSDSHTALPLFTADPTVSMCPPRTVLSGLGARGLNESIPQPPPIVHRFLRGEEPRPRQEEEDSGSDMGLVPFIAQPFGFSSASSSGRVGSGTNALSREELISTYTKQIEQLTALVRSLSMQNNVVPSGSGRVAPILLSDGRHSDKVPTGGARGDKTSSGARSGSSGHMESEEGEDEHQGRLPPVLSRILVSNGKALLHPSLMNSHWADASRSGKDGSLDDTAVVAAHAQPQLLSLLVPASTIRWGNVWSPSSSYPSMPADSDSTRSNAMWTKHNSSSSSNSSFSEEHSSEPMEMGDGDFDSSELSNVWVEINCNILNTQLMRDVSTI